MKAGIEKTLISGIVAAIVTVFAIVMLSLWQSRRLQDTSAWVKHTNQVINRTHDVSDRCMRYELNVKNFLLTGDTLLLDSTGSPASALRTHISQLRQLTADNPVQQGRADSLLYYIGKDHELLDKAVTMSRSNDFQASAKLVAAEATLGYSRQIEALLGRLESEEGQLLDRRRKDNQRTAYGLQAVLWGLLVAVVILAIVVFKKVRVDLSGEKKAREQLSRFNRELEKEVKVQTANLRASEEKYQQLNEDLEKRATELATSNADLERFAYIASHDLQEPLRMVSSFLQLLQKKYAGQLDAKADQYIHYAVDGAERMKALVLDLLEYSRVGSAKENFVKVNTAGVLEEVGTIFREKIIASRARVEIDLLPEVRGDKVQLTQLFQNLVGNALKYHGEAPPVIRISAGQENGCWRFSVSDNGIGIDPRFFDKIFVIFQRLHNKGDYSGTGIGLAICKKIVERHGGRIWVESAPQKGSTFFFTIRK